MPESTLRTNSPEGAVLWNAVSSALLANVADRPRFSVRNRIATEVLDLVNTHIDRLNAETAPEESE